MTEEWRPIPGLEGHYDVSDQGRVRSLRKRGLSRGVYPYDVVRRPPLILRPARMGGGYPGVYLPDRPARVRVHRLVLEAFVGPCPPGHEGAHLNGVRHDNRLANLAWKTKLGNADDKRRHGTMCRGEHHGQARVTAAQVEEIRAAAARGEPFLRIARRFPISATEVTKIARYQKWAT